MKSDLSLPIEPGVSQLFIDDFLIERQSGLKRTLHQPVKDGNAENPLISLDNEFHPYPSTLEANGNIVWDPHLNRFVMFALGYAFSHQGWDRVRRYRFISEDGMNWTGGDKGKLQVVYPRSREDLYNPENNSYAWHVDMFSCHFDESNAEFPYQGWQWFAKWDDHGAMLHTQSRDGILWELGKVIAPYNLHPFLHQGMTMEGPGDGTCIHRDPLSGRILASIRYWKREPVSPGNQLRSRVYRFLDRIDQPLDLKDVDQLGLYPEAADKNGDHPWDEYYMTSTWRYETMWLGGLRIWHRDGVYPWSAAGSCYLKLVSSRDGLNWTKVPFDNNSGIPEVFIPNGPEGGNDGKNDGGYITEFNNAPLRTGNELIYYYGCSSFGKNQPDDTRMTGGGIFRARLRADGFVSVDAGCLTTPLLETNGNNLSINSTGPVAIELLDSRNQLVGSGFVDSDGISNKVQFLEESLKNAVDRDNSINGLNPFKIRFRMETGGKLYSFKVD